MHSSSMIKINNNTSNNHEEKNHLHPVHKSTKVGNSFNEIESKKNVLNRMI